MFGNEKDQAFNLTLEILKGCGFSCQDCAIDKTLTSDFIHPGDDDRLLALVDAMRDRGFRLHEFTLGPTDIISSKTGMGILDRSLIKALAARYDSLTVSLALLFDTNLVPFAQKVDKLMAGKKFRLIVPATLKNIRNEKFTNMLRERIGIIRDNLHETEFKLLYLGINLTNATAEDFHLETNRLAHELDLGVPKLVEYNFPHSRLGLEEIMIRQKFLREFRLFTDGMKECNDTQYNRYLIPTVSDSLEFAYHKGELYYVPVLMEKFPMFIDPFKFPRPWDADELISFKEQMYYKHLEVYADHPDCGECCFFDNCARGDTQLIMDTLRLDTCLLDMKNRWDLTPITNPVREDE